MPAENPRKLRVLLVLDNLDLSGAEKVAINLLRYAGEFTFIQIRGVVCMDDRIGCATVAPGLSHLTLELKSEGRLLFRLWKAIVAARRLRSLSSDFDMLMPLTPPAAIMAKVATLFSRRLVVPWVHYDLQGIERDRWPKGRRFRGCLQGLLYKYFVPTFDRLIFVSEACRASFAREHGGSFKRDWIVLPNPLDLDGFMPQTLSSTEAAMLHLKNEGKPVLLFLGRLYRQKRWEDAISIAERLADAGFAFNMAFVGDGIERDQFMTHLERSSARHLLHYLGPDKNPRKTLELADGLILTSLFEAWPVVILEAFAAKVPVFSYDCPSGPKEMLGAGARGAIARESPDDMARVIIEYYGSSAESRQAMLEMAHEFALQFGPDKVVAAWEPGLLTLAQA